MQREHVHQKRGCSNQSRILLSGLGTLLFSDDFVCWKVESARWAWRLLKNAASGAFLVRDIHVGAERQCPRHQNAFLFVKGIHPRRQCGGGTFSHACESLYSWALRMISNHHKIACKFNSHLIVLD